MNKHLPACSFRLLAIAMLLILLSMAQGCSDSSKQYTDAGLPVVDGKHWLLINYWAIWCKPCLQEIPHLNDFASKHADKAIVYAVNYDGVEGAELDSQASQLNIRYSILRTDPAVHFGYARAQVLPATYIITPDGELKDTLYGPQTVESLEKAIGLEM
jgi:thiol-disulfide isomerase/thioredoxin